MTVDFLTRTTCKASRLLLLSGVVNSNGYITFFMSISFTERLLPVRTYSQRLTIMEIIMYTVSEGFTAHGETLRAVLMAALADFATSLQR